MALAWIEESHLSGSKDPSFLADIGKNRYFSYAIGLEEVYEHDGLRYLADIGYQSPLIGPLPDDALGRKQFTVARNEFDKDNCCIQLFSFRDVQKNGPAISNILKVNIAPFDSPDLPHLQFSIQQTMQDHLSENIPYQCRELPSRSRSMFLGGLMSFLPTAIPIAGKLLGSLFGGGSKPSGGGEATDPLAGLASLLKGEEGQKIITQLLGLISGGPAASKAASLNGLNKVQRTKSLAIRHQSRQMTHLSQAQIAPALLAAIPALTSLLQQVAKPDTIKAIGDVASKPFDSTVGVVRDLFGLNEKVEAPELNDAALDQMLNTNQALLTKLLLESSKSQSQSLQSARQLAMHLGFSKSKVDFIRAKSVSLKWENMEATQVGAKTFFPFSANRVLQFPISVETPQTIHKVILKLTIRREMDQKVVIQKKYPLQSVSAGPLPLSPQVDESDLKVLESGQNYLVCCKLIWKNAKGNRIGTSLTQFITLIDEYFASHSESTETIIPLNDVKTHRAFWHKIWFSTIERGPQEINMDCTYYYSMGIARNKNGRMGTDIRDTQPNPLSDSARADLELNSGMVLSPTVLNQMLPTISNHQPLSDQELKAVLTLDFVKQYANVARLPLRFKGLRGDMLALWVYPEVKLMKIDLKKVDQINENGLIQTFVDHQVFFPVPDQIHFIGTRAE